MKNRLIALGLALFALAVTPTAIAASLTDCKKTMGNFKNLGNVSERSPTAMPC